MLDLAFVRDHLPLVEEKLRQRGMNPEVVLGDFHAIDLDRRAAITKAETLKAERNKATEEIAKLKKEKQDATALINQTKELREKISEAEKIAEEADARLRNILIGIPNLPDDSVPVGKSEADNVEVRRWGSPPQFDFAPSLIGNWARSWEFSTWNARPS
jgi:seryl-tRNA synthetase